MKPVSICAMVFALCCSNAQADNRCLDPDSLLDFDAEWERALLEVDVDWLEAHVSDQFVWVHNHASQIDSKEILLARADVAREKRALTRSRVQSDVEARIVGTTGLVTGFTVVDRESGAVRYNFMRTYAVVSGRCLLLGNHTMAVPED